MQKSAYQTVFCKFSFVKNFGILKNLIINQLSNLAKNHCSFHLAWFALLKSLREVPAYSLINLLLSYHAVIIFLFYYLWISTQICLGVFLLFLQGVTLAYQIIIVRLWLFFKYKA